MGVKSQTWLSDFPFTLNAKKARITKHLKKPPKWYKRAKTWKEENSEESETTQEVETPTLKSIIDIREQKRINITVSRLILNYWLTLYNEKSKKKHLIVVLRIKYTGRDWKEILQLIEKVQYRTSSENRINTLEKTVLLKKQENLDNQFQKSTLETRNSRKRQR